MELINFSILYKRKKMMIKFPILLSAITVAALLQGCQSGNTTDNKTDTVFTASNYIAVDGKDTALLSLQSGKGVVKGKLLINLYNKEDNDGYVRGAYKGDTLFVDYTFRKGAKTIVYKNPLALLMQNGKLVLGVGKMESVFGRTYFRKDIPIEFYEGRFTFTPLPSQ